ncbi:hypothetical protein [Hazenella coriacea]|uniref:Lipoprotein n=1 Tax=Hazenella coriacea TaxID=1179467 RepID=A0A4R3L354_9BACL|nr:hypothetical protein [Hazenella coriacea]TCS93662.1 hypothetical protein EDD58_10695 [Hazenella coriacea]
MNKYLYLLLSLLLLILSACSQPVDSLKQSKLAVIYTDATQPDSELVFLDDQGKLQGSQTFKEMGIFQMETNEHGELILPVQFGNHIIYVHPDGTSQTTDSLQFPLFVLEKKGIRVSTYNTELDAGTLEIKQDQLTKLIKLNGFLRVATFDESFVYVFASIINQKRPVLYVIDRQQGKLVRTLDLKIDLVTDLEIVDQHLLLTSIDDKRLLARVSLTDWNIEYIQVPVEKPEFLLIDEENIYLTYQEQSTLSILNRSTLKVIENIPLEQPVFKVRMDESHLYVLTPYMDHPDLVGQIRVYEKKTWSLKKTWDLPAKREMLVQDFVLLAP